MARALSHDARLIVMDEPSAVLDSEEVANLFRVIRDLTAAGRRRRLHLPPPGGDPPDRRPDHRPQGRPHRRHRPARSSDTPTARADPADDRARGIEYVFPPRNSDGCGETVLSVAGPRPGRRVRRRQLRRPGRRDRRSRRAGRRGTLGDPRDDLRRPPRDRRHGPVDGERPAPRLGGGRGAGRASGFCPEERKSQGLLLDESVYATSRSPSSRRFARLGFLDEPAERGGAREQIDQRSTYAGRPRRARSAPSPAATSRRSCSPAGCCAAAGCCCSTSRPAASTSAPAPRSTR